MCALSSGSSVSPSDTRPVPCKYKVTTSWNNKLVEDLYCILFTFIFIYNIEGKLQFFPIGVQLGEIEFHRICSLEVELGEWEEGNSQKHSK